MSTTGIATPSLDARNGPAIGLRDDVRRVPVFGMGCAGGVNGLATAARLAAAEPGNALAVRHHRNLLDRHPPRQRRSRGDRRHRHFRRRRRGGGGQAGDGGIATIAGAGERMWPDTLNIMGWRVEDPGFAVVFDRAIPPFVEAELAGAVDGMLDAMGRSRERHRPLLLPPRRGQGDRRDRERAGAAGRDARPGAGRAQRLRQYERADRAVRARPADRAGPAGAKC